MKTIEKNQKKTWLPLKPKGRRPKKKKKTKLDQLKAKTADKERERNILQKRPNDTKTLDGLREKEAEIRKKIDKDKTIIDDADAPSSDREAARERVDENQHELARLQAQIAERERELPLRERIKEIFKKYGFTVTAIVLAAGVTIGAVIGAITKSLKDFGKGVVSGLKEIVQKTASLLPGLIGSIVSFLFKTAGQAVRFLAGHTWLIILAVVAFLAERLKGMSLLWL